MPPKTSIVRMKALNCRLWQIFNQARTTLNAQVKKGKLSDILEAMVLFYQQQLWTSATLQLLPLRGKSTNIKKKKKSSTISCWVFHKKGMESEMAVCTKLFSNENSHNTHSYFKTQLYLSEIAAASLCCSQKCRSFPHSIYWLNSLHLKIWYLETWSSFNHLIYL